jgi:ElaB/YqjD/DUF883 family membrane-anchored ribosome-binding protein
MPNINDLRDSFDKLMAQARETSEIGVQVARDEIHKLVKDPETVRKMEDFEENFDKQFREVATRIEDSTRQMASMFDNLMSQVPFGTKPESAQPGTKAEKTETKSAE